MSISSGRWLAAALAFAAAGIAASPSPLPAGCRLEDGANQLVRIYECQEKLRIAAETATKLSAIQRNGRLVGLRVEGGAVLVERSGRAASFQIVTPQAVTDVREASVAVDVKADGTSVFVREGGVSVSQDGRAATLGPGEGVDVSSATSTPPRSRSAPPGSAMRPDSASAPAPGRAVAGSLQVKTWGATRSAALLARLGRS